MTKPIFFVGPLLVVLATLPTLKASEPTIAGRVNGIELCPKFVCGKAVFTGFFAGEVNGQKAFGTWLAAIDHGPLPNFGDDPVTAGDGQWSLRTWVFRGFFPLRKSFGGDFGTGTLAALPGNFYQALVPMTVTSGGSGPIILDLTLDENSIPQPVNGTLTQPASQ